MNYLNRQQFDLGADSQDDAVTSTAVLDLKARQIEDRMFALPASEENQRIELGHQLALLQIDQEKHADAWNSAMPALKMHLRNESWEQSVVVCDTLFRCNHDDSLVALGHALWLSITFPVDVTLTIAQLRHVIDETPSDSDGGAVAAAMAGYVNQLRGSENNNDDAALVVGQLLNDVARRHSNVQNQEEFDHWFSRLELDQPDKLVVRMRNIIDVLVQDQWWIDRDELQKLIPS